MIAIKKLLWTLVVLAVINIASASVGVNGYSAPTYVEYSSSMTNKKLAVRNVLENAKLYDGSIIYIYYHDDKSKKMATTIQSRMQDKLPPHTTVVLLDQATGSPKYTYQYTPDGVAIISKDGKCIQCQQSVSQ